MAVPSGPKGTRDFYPEQMAFQEYLFASWQKTCRRYGFESYEAPMFEHLDIYTQKSGAEIENQLYVFADKGNRMIALRPEMTPSLARMVAAQGAALKRPVRWYSIPRLFRYERMQKGRLREFFQLNMDILGIAEVSADAELIAAVIAMMCDLGLTNTDFQVRISSRTLLEELFSAVSLDAASIAPLYALLDRKNKISPEQYQSDLATIIPNTGIRERITTLFDAKSLDEIVATIGTTPAVAVLTELFSLLGNYGMSPYICFDIGIVRGLAYYTGIVFEVFDMHKTMRAIAGGGRYDNLVSLYGGPSTPAVGFAAGDVVLGDLLRAKGLLPSPNPRTLVYVVAMDEAAFDQVIPTAQLLRNNGISCEFALKRVVTGKQLKMADATGAPLTLFLSSELLRQSQIKIKRMVTGDEETISQEDLLNELRKLLL